MLRKCGSFLCNIVLAVSMVGAYLCVELWSEYVMLGTRILRNTVSSAIDRLKVLLRCACNVTLGI